MNNILYVTTSTQKMYNLSGLKLINSFIKYQEDSTLLYLTENFELPIKKSNILEFDISQYLFLLNWLKKNKNIIPIEFGGKYDYKIDRHSKSKYMIPQNLYDWNYKSSLWFRKIAALHYALTKYRYTYDYIIWIDNDCEIKQKFDEDFIKYLFNDRDFFYFLGRHRVQINFGVESGFMGFSRKGYFILELLFDYYESNKFTKEIRWDDGWIFKIIITILYKNYNYKGHDVGSYYLKNDNNVMMIENVQKYIIHYKGIHWKENIDYNHK